MAPAKGLMLCLVVMDSLVACRVVLIVTVIVIVVLRCAVNRVLVARVLVGIVVNEILRKWFLVKTRATS